MASTALKIVSPDPKQPEVDSEKDLLIRLQSNPREAFSELIGRYRQEIYDLAVRVTGSRTEAEDVTQETFIKAYEHIKKFRGDSSLKTWLYRITINRSISVKRRVKRWRVFRGMEDETFPDLPELSTPSSEQEVILHDQAGHAHQALQKLPVKQRTSVILRVIKEMSYEEVARTMGISTGGAKANVHQGLKKLKTMLEEKDG